MNAEAYRGIFEAAGHRLNETGGVMLWKLNAAFPSVVWQVYGWFLQPNAGYYFMQNACEPVHIQFNYDDSTIAVVNRTFQPVNKLTTEVKGFNMDGKQLFEFTQQVDMPAATAKSIIPIGSSLVKAANITFVVSTLKDSKGERISNNSYWLAPGDDFKALSKMPKTKVSGKILSTSKIAHEQVLKMNIENKSNLVAFFIRPQLLVNQEEIQPVFWSTSYFTLAPNSSRTVTLRIPDYLKITDTSEIKVSGWNLDDVTLPIEGK